MSEKKPKPDGGSSAKGAEYSNGSLISENPVKILLAGIGGGGTATVARLTHDIAQSKLYSSGDHNNLTIALLNTDRQALEGYYRAGGQELAGYIPKQNVIQLGETGLGGGANPEVGAYLMDDAIKKEKLNELLKNNYDLAIFVGTFGKATGTGGLPILAEHIIKNNKATVPLAVVTFPFECEGDFTYGNAVNGYNALSRLAPLKLLTLYNENLGKMAAAKHSGQQSSLDDLSLEDAFKLVDGVLSDGVRTIVDIVMRVGNPNADFNDVKRILSYGREFSFVCASAKGEDRLQQINEQITSASLDGGKTNLTDKAKGILAAFYAMPNTLKLSEYRSVLQTLKSSARPSSEACEVAASEFAKESAKIIYAVFPKEFSDEEKNRLDVSLILAGGDAVEDSEGIQTGGLSLSELSLDLEGSFDRDSAATKRDGAADAGGVRKGRDAVDLRGF